MTKERRSKPMGRRLGRLRGLTGGLVLSLLVGCRSLAGPLSASGVTRADDLDLLLRPQNTAWFVCFRGRYQELAPDLRVVSRYRDCQLVVSDDREHDEMLIMAALRLGPADQLTKVDPGTLVKAIVRVHPLHLVVTLRESAGDEIGARVHEQMACRSRSRIGTQLDLDCPWSALPFVLGLEDVESIEIYNRHWVRWR